MSPKWIITALLVFVFSSLVGQSVNDQSFLIFTMERTYNKGNDKKDVFYWIVPQDSLSKNNSAAPFYTFFISKKSYNSCVNNKKVSFYLRDFSLIDTSETFVENQTEEEDKLQETIFANRKHILNNIKK